MRKHLNTNDVDLLSLPLRPGYLPREFGQVLVTVVYIPPWPAKHEPHSRWRTLCENCNCCQRTPPTSSSETLTIPTSDLVYRLLKNTSPARHEKTIDLCYRNIPGAFRSFALPPNREFRSQHSAPRASLYTKGADRESREETRASVVS